MTSTHRQPHERSRVTQEQFDDRVGRDQLPALSTHQAHAVEHPHLVDYEFASADPGYLRLLLDAVDGYTALSGGMDEDDLEDARDRFRTKTGVCTGYLLAVSPEFGTRESTDTSVSSYQDITRVHVAHVHRLQQAAQDAVVSDVGALATLTRREGLRGLYESVGLGGEWLEFVDAIGVDHDRRHERESQVRGLLGQGLGIADLLRSHGLPVQVVTPEEDAATGEPDDGATTGTLRDGEPGYEVDAADLEEPEPATVTGP